MENKKSFWEHLTRNQFLLLSIIVLIISILCAGLGTYNYFFTKKWNISSFRNMIFLSFIGASFFCYCIRKFNSFSTDKNATVIDIKDNPYILYLRSFNDDSKTDQPLNYFGMIYTEEEILVTSLKKLGEAVAIGRPGEKVPPLGAKRIYISDDQWQYKVRELSANARLIIFRIGETEGLKWEWSHCLETIKDISKLLLVVPVSITSEQNRIDQLVANIKKQRDDIQCDLINLSHPLGIGSIGTILFFDKNEDGTFSVKQTHEMSFWVTLSFFSYCWKAFCNNPPETRDFYIAFGYSDPFDIMKCYLEPIFNRFNISPYNEKLAYWVFRIVQAVEYFFALLLVFMTILIICGLLGLLK